MCASICVLFCPDSTVVYVNCSMQWKNESRLSTTYWAVIVDFLSNSDKAQFANAKCLAASSGNSCWRDLICRGTNVRHYERCKTPMTSVYPCSVFRSRPLYTRTGTDTSLVYCFLEVFICEITPEVRTSAHNCGDNSVNIPLFRNVM